MHPSGLLDLLLAIFEEFWTASTGFISERELPGSHDAIDRDLLKLLLLGLTKQQPFPFAGTSVLIMVGVGLETVKQIESQLMLRNYEGFLR